MISMPRWAAIGAALFIILCAALRYLSVSSVDARGDERHKIPQASASRRPGVPDVLDMSCSGEKVRLLHEAGSISEIVNWSSKYQVMEFARYHSLVSFQPYTEWFLLTHPVGSGRISWWIYLFRYAPEHDKDKKPWKLVYVSKHGLPDNEVPSGRIECIYIDAKTSSLVIADRRGRQIMSFDLRQELLGPHTKL